MSYSEFLESYLPFRETYTAFLKSWRVYQAAIKVAGGREKRGKR